MKTVLVSVGLILTLNYNLSVIFQCALQLFYDVGFLAKQQIAEQVMKYF